MADIKTRDVLKGTIKQLDKAAMVGDRMRIAYVSTKDKAEHSVDAAEHSPGEYASDRVENAVDRGTHEAAYFFDNAGRKGVKETKQNILKAKDGIQKSKERRSEQSFRRQAESSIKQSARSAGNKTIKTTKRATVKTAQKSIKSAEKTAKTTIKTTQQAAKTAQKTAQTTVKASQKAAHAAKATAKAVSTGIKATVKATIAVVKGIISATKAIIAAIAAGGWVAVIIIVAICLIALLCGSVFGIFFSGEDSGTGQTMHTAVHEINADYETKIEETKGQFTYDVLEMSGSRAVWPEVLSVYAVKTTTNPDNPQEVATITDEKKQLLKDIFWDMNEISHQTETKTETVIKETDDGNGNILEEEVQETRTILYITVSHKTADEMAGAYGFNEEQNKQLEELLVQDSSMWAAVLYGIYGADDQIVSVALSQLGNVGGEPYWSWYGFTPA